MEFISARRFCHALEATFTLSIKKRKKAIDLVDNVDEFIFRFFWLTAYVVLKQKTFILKFTTRMPGFKVQLAPPTMNIYGKA